MESLITLIKDAGTPGIIILMMGLAGLALIIERVKVLYFDYAIKSEEFMAQIKTLVLNDKVEDAITFCASNDKAPLPHVVKGVLERSDRDDEGIYQGLDIALSEVIPLLGKRLGYLAMISNVATLVGLLGTITGLISAFEAVSYADPAQKQALLSKGISMAMNTTAMGLSVAIPVLMVYAFLHARQNHLLEEISEQSTKVVDMLTTRHYQPFEKEATFPKELKTKELKDAAGDGPPPTSVKSV
tara:strand:+ start:377 stop:1105 length:729 start_codon:yes stop_codon:yes gene_type:complete